MGWSLTDDDSQLDKWKLPQTSITANGYLLVFASGNDRAVAGEELHTNFKLNSNGEYLGLVRPDGSTIESEYQPEFPAQKSDISYGVGADLVLRGYFLNPTPGSANMGIPLENPDGAVVITEIMYHLPTASILDAEKRGPTHPAQARLSSIVSFRNNTSTPEGRGRDYRSISTCWRKYLGRGISNGTYFEQTCVGISTGISSLNGSNWLDCCRAVLGVVVGNQGIGKLFRSRPRRYVFHTPAKM
jgi:hypothetical protein